MEDLSFSEKVRLLVAKDDFVTYSASGKLIEIVASDGPCGLRRGVIEHPKGEPSTCYPSPHVIANSWDVEVAYNIGVALASDCIEKEIDIVLAPGINIKRTPLCGRNFEYFSEDPYLTGVLASEYVKGVQDKNVGACLKHFCANNREYDRLHQSSDVDERTLREIYTKAFEIVINRVQPYTVMCSYNPVNGINMSENSEMLRGVLREKLNYNGVVISDWCSVHNRADALKASVDIMFPFEQRGLDDLNNAILNKKINEKDVDESVNRILNLTEIVKKGRNNRNAISKERRKEISLNGAEKGIVLLKNNLVLPLRKEDKIAVFGDLTACVGGGSAQTVLEKTPNTLWNELEKLMPNTEIKSHWLYRYSNSISNSGYIQMSNLKLAYELAENSDVTVLIVGDNELVECECYDRIGIKLLEPLEDIIIKISSKAKKLVVVLETGSAVDVSRWEDKVDAIVYSGFAGENMNVAIAEILAGKISPSGRLSETFPISIYDTPTGLYNGDGIKDVYTEGIYVGYRYYTTKDVKVKYPFGFGLSYADFKYTDFTISKKDNDFLVSFFVENVSKIFAGEVVQLYVKNIGKYSVDRPIKELRRFDKVYLNPKERVKIEFVLNEDCFSFYSVEKKEFVIENGEYEIAISKNVNEDIFTCKVLV